MSAARLTWVVLSWNGREDTLACLAALDPADPVVVVDNGSADGTVAAVRARFGDRLQDLAIVENGANLGFSGGNNAGIRRALDDGADWVVLLNNDARPRPGTLDALRAAAQRHPDAGVLAGKLVFDDGRVQWAGQRVSLRTGYSGRPDRYGEPDGPASSVERPVPRAVGALMAVSRAAIDACGLLDDDLFAYVEDVDWSLRIRRAGFSCWLVPEAVAIHALSASTGGDAGSTHTMYYGARNTVVVCERHLPRGPARTWVRRLTIALAFGARAALVQRIAAAVRAVLDGVCDGVARRLGPRPA